MLKLRCLTLGFFQLVLGVHPKFASNIIDKDLKVFKIFLQEGFKL